MKSKRIHFLDIAKGLGIILVVFGHTYRGSTLINFIYTFHIPLFFTISGVLYNKEKNRNTNKFITKRIKTLLIPYLSFYIISYVYWFFVERHYRPNVDTDFYIPLFGFFYGSSYKMFLIPNGALWFLPCLFSTELLLHFSIKYIQRKYLFIVFLLSCIFGIVYSFFDIIPLPFGISAAFMALFFSGMGYLFQTKIKYMESLNRLWLLSSTIIFFSATFLLSTLNGRTGIGGINYNNPLLYLSAATLGTTAVLALSAGVKQNRIIEYLGVNSLIIFGLSEPIKRMVIYLLAKIISLPLNEFRHSILLSLISVVIIMLLLFPIVQIINNYLYFTIGKFCSKKIETIA